MKKVFIGVALFIFTFLAFDSISEANQQQIKVSYQTHIQNIGWQDYVTNGESSGTTGKGLRLEGIKIKLEIDGVEKELKYSTHVQDIGWQDNVNQGEMSGTEGKSKRLEAIKINLSDSDSKIYDIYYRVHIENFGWLDWAKNGQSSGSEGMSLRLEAIEVVCVPKAQTVEFSTEKPFIYQPKLKYKGHSQNIGWLDWQEEKNDCGVVGEKRALEAFKIQVLDSVIDGGIKYRAHVQDIGWQNFIPENEISGTTGKNKRIEALEVQLTGVLADYFDVYYRAHIENYGWLDWTKNGNIAGSEGMSLRLEAFQICLVSKNSPPPGKTDKPYVQKEIDGEYVIKVNKEMNCVTVYKGETPIKAFICSTGEYTPIGTFYTTDRYEWRALIHNVYGQYATRITGSILFHSVPYASRNKSSLLTQEFNKLGTSASAGCVRLQVADSKWIFDNCPYKTKVVIYNSKDPGPLGKPSAPILNENQRYDPTDIF